MIFSSISSQIVKSNRSIHDSVLNLCNLCTLHVCADKFRILSYSCLNVGVCLLAAFMYLHIFMVLWNLSKYKYWINLLKHSKGFSHSTYHFPFIILTIDVHHFICNNLGEIMNWKPFRFCVHKWTLKIKEFPVLQNLLLIRKLFGLTSVKSGIVNDLFWG